MIWDFFLSVVCCQVQWNTLLNIFFELFFSFYRGLIHFAMSGHIHSIQPVQFSQFDRLFGLVLLFSLQYLPIFFTSSFFILIQRQSILLPAQWPCIFFPWPYHMFTFLRTICSGFNSLCNDSLLLFQWNQTKSRFFFLNRSIIHLCYCMSSTMQFSSIPDYYIHFFSE